ncbi:archease [Methylomicrobium lacus]|uniref:archease n=1 Tax=Methylomicrobium lacus TaxID=136992 RepID=UPI0035A8E0E8
MNNAADPHWEHFDHDADIGIRGIASTLAESFEQAALALIAVITDPDAIKLTRSLSITCSAADPDILFYDWINELIFQMTTKDLLFGRFEVAINKELLTATAFGELVDRDKHQPAVEIKGATFTELRVYQNTNEMWVAQCIVDV